MITSSLFVLVFAIIIFIFYKWLTSTYKYFEKLGVPYVKPFKLFWGLIGLYFSGESPLDFSLRLYSKFRDEKLYGMFEFRKPILVINDPDIIKQVMVKDSDHFINHRVFFEGDTEPLFTNSLVFLRDQKWKDMRKILTPAFTGSKLRGMFELVEKCSEAAIIYLKKETTLKIESIEIDTRDFFTRYANDAMATTAFGLSIDSFKNKENDFYKMAKMITTLSSFTFFKMFFLSSFKILVKLFNIRIFDEKCTLYFRNLVVNAMKYRLEKNIKRNDMINLLLEAQAENPQWSENEIVAQSGQFLFSGFDTTPSLMCFCAQELMENPKIQDKLIEEIDEYRKELNGKPLTYDFLQKMKYLDMVVSETLRKWPQNYQLDRFCNKSYTIQDFDTGKSIEIPAGIIVVIPIVGMHYDPKYFPNPTQFDPERFSDDNKSNIKPFTYLPFGAGPRSCIGNRFVLMETKAILFRLLSEFKLKPSPKSTIPMKLSSGFQFKPVGGFYLILEKRDKNFL